MIDISVNELVKSFEVGQTLLDGLSFDIHEGECVGIMGRNGCGKTTLFRLLTGELSPDSGEIHIAAGKKLGLISQIPVYPAEYTVEDVLRTAFSRMERLKGEMDALAEKMAAGDSSAATLKRYGDLSARFEGLGGWDTDTAVSKVANGLTIDDSMRSRLFSELSGGEKTRVNLGRLILEDTDILLLDEPTNHMDIPAKETLESAFRAYTGTLLFVSHDRYFIRQVAESLLIFDDQSVFYYPFGYEHYLAHRNQGSGEELAASLRAEEQALLSGLQSVPMPERHRLREYSTEQSYEDWQLRLLTEPMEQTRMELEQFWNARDEIQEWTDPAYAEDCLLKETALTDAYTKCCLAWYDKWAEFHPEPDKETGLLPS